MTLSLHVFYWADCFRKIASVKVRCKSLPVGNHPLGKEGEEEGGGGEGEKEEGEKEEGGGRGRGKMKGGSRRRGGGGFWNEKMKEGGEEKE
jgi:hypothetical protein